MLFNNEKRLESQSSRKRYLYGVQVEDLIVKALETHGLVFENVDRNARSDDKINRLLNTNGKKKPCLIKSRMAYSGDDVLIDVYEPFHGIDSPATMQGRDYLGKYEVYICLSRDGKTIRVIDGSRQKQIVEYVLDEWKAASYRLPVFDSGRFRGVQLRYTTDRANGRSKLLMFIRPSVYKPGSEINLYDMKWPAEPST